MNNIQRSILIILQQDIFEFLSYREFYRLAITPKQLPADATMKERMENSVLEIRRDVCIIRVEFDIDSEELGKNYDHLLRTVVDAEAALQSGTTADDEGPYKAGSQLKMLLTAVRERTWECCRAREAFALTMASHKAYADLANSHYKFEIPSPHIPFSDFKSRDRNPGTFLCDAADALANIAEDRQTLLTEPLSELNTYLDSVLAVHA